MMMNVYQRSLLKEEMQESSWIEDLNKAAELGDTNANKKLKKEK
jgi:hypothetical protein